MELKTAAIIGVVIGGIVWGYIPAIWGDSMFSFSGVIFSAIGGLLGIFIAYKYLVTILAKTSGIKI